MVHLHYKVLIRGLELLMTPKHVAAIQDGTFT